MESGSASIGAAKYHKAPWSRCSPESLEIDRHVRYIDHRSLHFHEALFADAQAFALDGFRWFTRSYLPAPEDCWGGE